MTYYVYNVHGSSTLATGKKARERIESFALNSSREYSPINVEYIWHIQLMYWSHVIEIELRPSQEFRISPCSHFVLALAR